MNSSKIWLTQVLGHTVLLFLISTLGTTGRAWAQLSFNPTSSSGAPGNRESGANRSGACAQDDNGLVALLPETNLALTADAYPSVYAYFPDNTAQYAEFALYEEGSNELIYGTLFNVNGRSGLVSIDMPDNATLTPLQVGRRYYWYLSLICDVQDRSGDLTVQGNFERVTASGPLNQQLQSSSPGQHPFVYAEAGLWPETVTSLLELSQSNPGDQSTQQNLSALLRSVGLTTLANQRLLP